MRVVKELTEYRPSVKTALTVGKFDGIHRGHQALIEKAVRFAREETAAGRPMESLVLSFDMSPRMLLSGEERRHLLSKMGVDTLIECSFTQKIMTMEADRFVREIIAGQLHAGLVIAGRDFRFGYERRGDAGLLRATGEKNGFMAVIEEDVFFEGERISSSRIRGELLQGRMETVNSMLGYPFFVTGEIIHGRRLGRTIGVPTANLVTPKNKLLPPNGVYYTRCEVRDIRRPGMTNIGTKPTVNGSFVGVETCLYDTSGDFYGDLLKVELHHYARPEKRFASLEELKNQIMADEADGRTYWKERGFNEGCE